MQGCKLSVITVCYNAEKTIENTILSILNQTYHNYEYIVVDGKSTDGTNQIIKRYLSAFHKRKINVKYISESDNGIYDAMNKGIEMAEGEWIAFMNADDSYYDKEVLSKVFEEPYDGYDVLYGSTNYITEEEEKIDSPLPLDVLSGQMAFAHQSAFVRTSIMKSKNFVRKRKDFPLKDKYIREMLYYRDCIPHPTWFVKKELYDKLQGYRNIPFSEDYDFLVRAALIGTRFGVLPQVCLKYRINSNGITQRNLALQKFLSRYIQQQYRSEDIMDSGDVQEYIKKNQKQFDYIIKFYELAKKSRKTPVIWLQLIFFRQMFAEVRERLATKIILWKDKHGYC